MNNKAKQIGMDRTKYSNSHGLSNCENKSCSFDLAVLCEYVMNNMKFCKIVSCKSYTTVI